MKKLILILLIITTSSIYSQGLTIGSGTTLSLGDAAFTLTNNWTNEGTFDPGTGTIIFDGAGGDQYLANSAGEIFYNVTVNKSSGNLLLSSDVTVNGTLTVTSGDLDLNGNTLTLGNSASLSESEGNTVSGSTGTITTTRELNAPSSLNVAGLGAIITSASDLGSTVITRGHEAQTGSGNTGIKRYYEITPSNNSGLNAQLTFCYDDSELNGVTESELCLFRSADSGVNWTLEGGACNTTTNEISISGIDSFSRWTAAGSSSPLPVEITSFEGFNTEDGVLLNWETATETNNYGFEVQKSEVSSQNSEENWNTIGFVQGHGTTNSPKHYEFTDYELPDVESVDYRLKQIDNDGSFTYSKTVTVDLTSITSVEDEELPTVYSLEQNYPNPFNPSTTIKFSIASGAKQSVFTTLKIYNMLGQEVKTLVNQKLQAGYHEVNFDASNFSSGMYIYKLTAGNFTQTKKLMLLK